MNPTTRRLARLTPFAVAIALGLLAADRLARLDWPLALHGFDNDDVKVAQYFGRRTEARHRVALELIAGRLTLLEAEPPASGT